MRDRNWSRCHRDVDIVDKFVGRTMGYFLRLPDSGIRYEVAAVFDVPSDLPGRGG